MKFSEYNLGLFYGALSFLMWGLFPIYFKQLTDCSAYEILAHRIFWSLVLLFILIRLSNRWQSLKAIFAKPKDVILLMAAGIFISMNWGIYIYAVNSNQILATSLGYFITPFIYLLFGVFIFKEKISLTGKLSVALLLLALSIQIYAIKQLPLISLSLPLTFSIYGLIKKKVNVPTVEGLFIENTLICLFAIIYLSYLGIDGISHFKFDKNGLLLMGCGIITVLPLLTFNGAAARIKLSTIGFLQYLSPSVQISIAVFIYNESLDSYKIISFLLIWVGLIIMTTESIIKRKKGRK